MKSYFFVPASLLDKVHSVKELKVDDVIIDLEDAVKNSERNFFLEKLKSTEFNRNAYIRIPIYSTQNRLDFKIYLKLKSFGYFRFVFPKIKNLKDFELLSANFSKNDESILLIEEPLLFVELGELLQRYSKQIKGIGLGSHDLMNYISAEHTLENLKYYRNKLLLLAKAYGIEAIDIASMELHDESELKNEILDGFNMGFDAKFLIHPWQVQVKDSIQFFSDAELAWAMKIFSEFQKVENSEEFNPITVDGKIIEKPHLNKMFKIF